MGNGNAFSNACLPAPAENYAILPYWDDQETVTGLPGCTAWANGCGIFTTQVGSTFYIDYHTVLFANTATALEYEIAFTQGSPDVHIVYGTPVVDTGSETIGVQKDTGSAFTQYTCDAAAGITSGLEVDFVASTCGGSTPTPTATVCAAGTPGPWTAAAPYPETIVRYGFAQVADSFYVIGGVSNGSAVTTVYRYDVGPGTWTQLADDPGAGEALACAYNAGTNKIYCTQGINGNGFDIYDIGANTWSAGPAIPGGADRYGAAAGSSGSSVYVVGGGAAGASTDVEVYDTGSNSWSSGAAIPAAYEMGGYQTAGQYLYAVGSYGASPAGASRLSQAQKAAVAPDANSTGTYRLDMSTGTWSTGPTWTPGRADFGLAYVDGTLVAMGGDATGGGYFDSTNLVDQLDVSAWPGGSWTASPPLLPAPNRQANQAGFTSSDGRIWSVGGLDGSTFTFLADNYYRAQGGACGTATPTPVGGTPTPPPPDARAARRGNPQQRHQRPDADRPPLPRRHRVDLRRPQRLLYACRYLSLRPLGAVHQHQRQHRLHHRRHRDGLQRQQLHLQRRLSRLLRPQQHLHQQHWGCREQPQPSGIYGFDVPAGESFYINVHEVTAHAGCASDTMTVTGLPGGSCGTATPTPVGGTPTATPTSCAGPGTWATVTPLPQPLMGPATGSVGGVVYAAGGYNGSLPGRLSPAAPVGKAGKPAPGTEVNTSYAYTDATGWTAIAPDLVAVFDGSGVSDGSSFYVIGGYNTAGGVDTATQIYDPGTNSWALGAPIPQGVAGAQAVYYNGKIYVIGGCGDGACSTVLNTVQIYDIAGNSWSSGATVPTGVTFGAGRRHRLLPLLRRRHRPDPERNGQGLPLRPRRRYLGRRRHGRYARHPVGWRLYRPRHQALRHRRRHRQLRHRHQPRLHLRRRHRYLGHR